MSEELTIDKEFAALWPPLSAEERELLESGLLADGCIAPLVTWANHDDTLLDGHHRYDLCKKNDIKFKTKAITLKTRQDAIEWILRHQAGRRNLTDSQRGMMAAKLATLRQGDNQHTKEVAHSVRNQTEAAEQFGVSRRTVQSAAKVLANGSKPLQQAVESGAVSVKAAAAVAELPKAEQNKAVAKGPEAVKEKAKEVKQYKDEFDTAKLDKQKAKPGSEKKSQFKDADIDDLFGKLMRAIDDRWNKNGGHGNKYRICLNAARAAVAAWNDWKRGAAA